jgi:predicted metal-dependent phosphoesterase TrpH
MKETENMCMMKNLCDLHLHSTCSDGTLRPSELIRMAETLGLGAVALCDHNTVAGLPEFLAAAAESEVEAVPGVEFSTDYRDGELHLLALFVEPAHYAAVTEKVEGMWRRKEQSNLELVRALNGAGMALDYEAIKSTTPNGQVNRAVIAAEMVRRGYCATVKEAFSCWLSPKHGYFVPPKRLDVFEMLDFIGSIEATSVLAHPFLNLSETELREFLKEAVPRGLQGMETEYPKFSEEQRRTAREIAREFGLKCSGGSDFHGANKPDIAMGTGRGDLRVPLDLLERLKR